MPTYVFGIDTITIQNQKADSDHSDNDWLTLTWSVANPVTKSVQTFKKTLRVGGVLPSRRAARANRQFRVCAGA